MKQLLGLSLWLVLAQASWAQPTDTCSYTLKGQEINVDNVLTNWGVSMNVGAMHCSYDPATNTFFGDHWGADFSLMIHRRNLSLEFYFLPATLQVNEPLDFGYQVLDENAMFNVIKTGILGGYAIPLSPQFGIQPQIGLLRTQFLVINEDEIGSQFRFDRTTGLLGGVSVNRYFQMRPVGEYLVLRLRGAVAFSGYENMHPILGNSFSFLEIGLGYHGWFTRRTGVEGRVHTLPQ